MIALLNNTNDLTASTKKNLSYMREKIITLTAQNTVSELVTFQKGETRFTIEASLTKRDYLLVSLGGFDISGSITAYLSRDKVKEFRIDEYQWVIMKADYLKKQETIQIRVIFT